MMNKKRRPQRTRRAPRRKVFVPSNQPKVSEEDVQLVAGKGTTKTIGKVGGRYWHVLCGEERAGRAYITYRETEEGSPCPSITVELNERSRGRGIGTIAFRKAAELSGYDEIYASVRKGNVASRKALDKAGFRTVDGWHGSQLYLVWKRDASS